MIRGCWLGQLAQLVRAFGSHPKGHRFESCIAHHKYPPALGGDVGEIDKKMTVLKNKFIFPKAAIRGQHLSKAAKMGEANQDAFRRKTGRMRFSFVPITNSIAVCEPGN